MKTNKTLGLFAVALTALACALPRTATADGDVRSIEFYPEPEGGEVGVVNNLDRPLVAGDKVKFRIRLANRQWKETDSDPTFLNPWQLRTLPGAEPISNRLPQVGLRVSGGMRYADIVSWDMSEGDLHHTDLICQYTVQAGDFALPLKLANSTGTRAAMEADPDDKTTTPEKKNYFLSNSSLWGFFPKNPTDNQTTNRLEFYFGPEVLNVSDYPGADSYRASEKRDYDLSGANIRIQAIDFDDTYVSNGVWRTVAAGRTTSTPAAPRLSIPGGASGSYTYYVWTKDPSVAEVEGGTARKFKDITGAEVTHQVATVTVSKDDTLVPFTIRATGKVGQTTEVYMSDTPSNICNRAGTLVTNFTTRVIEVITPPPPSFSVVMDPVEGVVSTSTNNYRSVATLDVELSEAWTQDVTIVLSPSMKSGSGTDPFKYIGMSTAMSGSEYYDGEVISLTVKAGKTKASLGGTMLYVYANRADADTAKGIRFTPTIDPASANAAAAAAFFTGESTPATLQINACRPVITYPKPDDEFANIPANTAYDFTINVADAMWELHGKTAQDGKYIVWIDYNGSGTYEPISNLTANASGEITFQYRYVVGGRDYQSKIYIENQDGITSGKENAVAYTVKVKAAKKIDVTLDNPRKTYCEGKTAQLDFTFSEAFDYTKDCYVFLEPADQQSRDLVECDAFDYGIPISVGEMIPSGSAYLTFKDGWKNCAFKYNVVVRSTDDPTDDSNIVSVWGSDGTAIYVTNAVPSVISVSMNSTPAYASGDTLTAKTAVGVQNLFEISAWDESYDVDLEEDTFQTVVKFWENGAVSKTVTLQGNPYGQQIPYTFSTGGEGVKNKVTVHVYDKDMTAAEKLVVDKNPFTVYVETRDAPAISLAPYNSSTYFLESDTGNTKGRIYVDLTVPPTGLGTGSITVHLDVERLGGDDGPLPVLSTYDLEFKNNVDRQSFFLSELDGTPQSEKKGFRIRASVVTTTQSPDATKTWAEYYDPCTDFIIFVENENPVIGPGAATTNEIPVAINVPYNIQWTADDIENDQSQLEVTWTYNGGSETTTEDMRNKTGDKEIVFTSSGSKTVTLMVRDKDGGLDTRQYFFYVAPSKVVELYPRGPADGAIGDLSSKYKGAAGLGAGRVWAAGADKPTEVSGFVHLWSYAPEELSMRVYARGYKLGDKDDGSLTPTKDIALDANGNYHESAGDYTSYFEYKASNYQNKNSYFYGWLYGSNEGEGSGIEVTHLNSAVLPEVGSSSKGEGVVTLPEYDEEADTYAHTMLEAIFSLEYLPGDHLGDINQDGIPDVFAAETEWDQGKLFVAAGYTLEDGGDLKSLTSWNSDVITSGSTDSEGGDFLPSAGSSGISIIPNIDNWATAGGKFTAYLELRGLDQNINYRTGNDGKNHNVRGEWVSAPNFSKAEWIALSYHNQALGCPVDLSTSENWDEDVATVSNWVLTAGTAWIPENRTDPTIDDTDGDGFPDGYEYYFWYRASVGEVNAKGEWVRLSGSRFTLNDIATGEELTPEEIAAAFDPTAKSSIEADLRDTDNDGLTDMEELSMGTNPVNWDSDGDGISDLYEIMHGMNPLKATQDEGATMNLDGDFMARWDSEAGYTIIKWTEENGTVREYARAGSVTALFKDFEGKDGEYEFSENAKSNQFTAISVFHYGSATNSVYVPRFRGGTVTNTVDGEAEALPLDALVWELGEATNEGLKVSVKLNQKITLIHDQVYAQYGFDPRTGWSSVDGFVAARWNPTTAGSEKEGDSGKAINTVKYTALDEYLLLKYRYETNKESPTKLMNKRTGSNVPFSIEGDLVLWDDALQRQCSVVLYWGCTSPNAPYETPEWVSSQTTLADVTFSDEIHGADTDKDGVPDGWELYVGTNPNSSESDLDADGDELALPLEFAGTDSCNAYAACETVVSNHPGVATGWYNKFFPTNPNEKDTDGDGIKDADEGATWTAAFTWGNKSAGSDLIVGAHTYTFIYGSNNGMPAADDGTTCIRGGGLNPCSVDTDGDALPDPWEREFAGVVFTPEGQPDGILNIKEGVLKLIRRADGLGDDDVAVDYYITAGMDGTFGYRNKEASFTGDAYANPTFTDPATGTVRDYDFDHDGLQNFQEYLVQALRHLRYDDAQTPLMGSWMPSGSAASRTFVGFLPMNVMDGETYYAEVKKAGFAATGAWDFRKLGYFAVPPHAWDKVALNTYTKEKVAYDEMGFRVMLRPSCEVGDATGYCTTDPRNWDTDSDGMDDYYELFHGLNPLLGEVSGGTILYDVIAQAYGGKIANWYNAWTGWPMMPPSDPVYDAMKYPWMMGVPGCDADGDGLNNYEETLYANLTSPQPTHTDPTPLWMTDSTALNKASFTSQYYWYDCDLAEMHDFNYYPAWVASADGMMFAFEENEGYDTDHDGLSDSEEKRMTATPISDPLDYTDPDRRQAIWFSGDKSAAVTYTTNPGNTSDTGFDCFRQFTAEAWINPEDVSRDQVIFERAVVYGANSLSNNASKVRANFRMGIRADGRVYGMYDSSDAVESGTAASSSFVDGQALEAGVWTHVAMTFDGTKLSLYVNGRKVNTTLSTFVPANGIAGLTQQPTPDEDAFPVRSDHTAYTFYTRSAMVVGAKALDEKAVALSENTTWESYDSFYKGYVDELRVWDGAKTDAEIAAGYKERLSVDDVKALRDEVYESWKTGATRNDNDANDTLPAELVFLYNFQNVPGAVEAADVMWEPSGFTAKVLDQVRVDGEEIPGDLYCGWWKALPVHSAVYNNYRWVPWMPNMVAHLPALDGSVADSKYWGELVAGVCAPSEAGVSSYIFPNSMNPYSLYWTQGGDEPIFYNNRLVTISEVDGSLFNDVYRRWRFQKERDSLGSTDLVPLGGAFAKRCELMWDGEGVADAWTYAGDDLDADGIPDWWQAYAAETYGAADGFTWESLVNYRGVQMTAREAYIRDLALGLQPNGTYVEDYMTWTDRDNDDLPDWWEDIYGIATSDGQDDSDYDGLDNRAEFVIAELLSIDPYNMPRINPTLMYSFYGEKNQLVPDYFLRIGKLYLGEMFSDHDFMEDAWEDKYEKSTLSRSVYDSWNDPDDDGWSNFAECRAATDPNMIAYQVVDQMSINAFPVPTIKTKLVYNGANASASQASVVIKAWREDDMQGKPDAVWVVDVGGSSSESSSDSSSSTSSSSEKIIGLNPQQEYTMNLGPGAVVPGSVTISFKDLTRMRQVGINGDMTIDESDWEIFVKDRPASGSSTKGNLVFSTSTNDAESVVGTIDYTTGEAVIQFEKIADDRTYYSVEKSGDSEVKVLFTMHLGQSYVLVDWESSMPKQGFPMTVYLSDPQSVTSTYVSRGRLREGKNTFIAFLDVDGNGAWSLGEPYGVVRNQEIGWSSANLAIELTDVSATCARYNLASGLSSSDSGDTSDSSAYSDRDVNGSYYANYGLYYTATNAVTEGLTRVRIVRTAMNDDTDAANGVVFDRELNLTSHPNLTEADVWSAGVADLDWGTLRTAWTRANGSDISRLAKVSYRVVLGNGSIEQDEWNNNIPMAFVNAFETGTVQTPTTPDANLAQVVYAGRPTFRWKHEPLDADGVRVKNYPAFQCRIYDTAGSVVWQSEVEQAPVRDTSGYYSWTAPISAGMVTKQGKVFAANGNYTWSISMLDAKFTTFGSKEVKTPFKMQCTGNANDDAGYGSLAVKVKYFGPIAEKLSASVSQLTNLIHVQAFTSPDFSGTPAGEGYVTSVANIASPSNLTVNALILGLEAGSYYVRAFIDTDADFAFDRWESWGYGCYVGDGQAPFKQVRRGSGYANAASFMYTPRAYTIAAGAEVPEAEVYIEDADTDGDALPDVWEIVQSKNLAANDPAAGATYLVSVNPTLANSLNAYSKTGAMGFTAEEFARWPLLSYLTSNSAATMSAAVAALLDVPVTITEAGIRIESFSFEDGLVLAAETETTTESGATLQSVLPPSSVTVLWELLYAETLDQEFTVVDSGEIVLSGDASAQTTVAFDRTKYSAKSGFFKVRVTRVTE